MALVFDVLAYGTLLLLVLTRRPLRAALAGLESWRRVALLALVLAVPVGQMIHKSEWTYPFVAWAMYTDRRPANVTWYEYSLVTSDGVEQPWPVAHEFSRLGKRVVWKLRLLEEAASTEQADRLLSHLAARSQVTHSGQPATAVRIWSCTLPVIPGATPAATTRTLRRTLVL